MMQRNIISIEIDTTDKVPMEKLDAICKEVMIDAMTSINNQGNTIVKAISSFYQPKAKSKENTNVTTNH